ncbi:MAG: ABC transporter permease, partial [Opitutaceae bacterium]|nr:ABC transporter permease [Opitutaceae bacterium]
MQALAIPEVENLHARRPRLWGWVLLAPLVGWLVVFVVVPMAILFVYSFCTRDDLGRVVFSFTLENYARVFDPIYLRILGRSVGFAAVTTLLCVAIGYPVAWYIARQRETIRDKLLLLVMIPFWTSFLIRTYAWIAILKNEGLLNG